MRVCVCVAVSRGVVLVVCLCDLCRVLFALAPVLGLCFFVCVTGFASYLGAEDTLNPTAASPPPAPSGRVLSAAERAKLGLTINP